MKNKILLIVIVTLLGSCSWNDVGVNRLNSVSHEAKDSIKNISPEFNNQAKRSFVRATSPKNKLLKTKIKVLKAKGLTFKQALKLIMPNVLIIAEDAKVNQNKIVNIDIRNVTYGDYFEYLSSQTGYRIELENKNRINISSADHMRWNVSALVNMPNSNSSVGGNAKAGSAGGSSSLSLTRDNDTWGDLLKGIKTILGASGVIIDNKRLGEIYALGDPQKLAAADKWVQRMIAQSQKQILLDVAILEVSLTDGSANGIDWKGIYNGKNALNVGRQGSQSLTGGGAWNIIAAGTLGAFKLDATINFLRKQGKVNVQHHPSLTVTNGSTAYLGSAEQFSYVSSIKNEVTTSNGISTAVSTPEVKTIDVGVNLSVTARLLENNEILVEVVPVISALQEVETLFTGSDGSVIKAPRITLQELATQVITKSGQPIHLGGMVSEKIIESAKNVPGVLGRLFNLIFQSESKQFEKKEILLIITPTEV
jgi:type II secretory pathway component GspD/PulD (secretin)